MLYDAIVFKSEDIKQSVSNSGNENVGVCDNIVTLPNDFKYKIICDVIILKVSKIGKFSGINCLIMLNKLFGYVIVELFVVFVLHDIHEEPTDNLFVLARPPGIFDRKIAEYDIFLRGMSLVGINDIPVLYDASLIV